nr:MAG TPA: hypothetical protein [Caudoviricetes sp.]
MSKNISKHFKTKSKINFIQIEDIVPSHMNNMGSI